MFLSRLCGLGSGRVDCWVLLWYIWIGVCRVDLVGCCNILMLEV